MPTEDDSSIAQTPSDQHLLERIALRDIEAMELLYNRHRRRFAGFLRRLTTDDDLIEEAYNDTMIKVWDKAHQFEGRSKASSWIFSIAYRICLRMVKANKRRSAVIELWGTEEPAIEDPSGDRELEPSTPNDEVAAAVSSLSPKLRLVVELCYFEGYSLAEIGEIARCPVNTVKTRLHHARKKIREHLRNAGASDFAAVGDL